MSNISLPKKIVKEIFEAGRRFTIAQDALEDVLLTGNPQFIKKMRGLRAAHREGSAGDWAKLKARHDL